MTVTLRESLSGKALLLTGATGFVGKAVLAQCLHELPETAVTVLLRGDARQRLEQVLEGEIFEGLDGSGVTAVSGDLSDEGLAGLAGIDVVVHCAASVSFEQPLDHALELNSKGPARLLKALRKGWPRTLVLNRGGADARRARLLRHVPTRVGYDRDEYPPAVGRGRGRGRQRGRNPRGWNANVAYVPSAENRSHGSTMGTKLRRFCNGTRFRYVFY